MLPRAKTTAPWPWSSTTARGCDVMSPDAPSNRVCTGGWPARPSATSAWRPSPTERVAPISELPSAPAAALASPANKGDAPNPAMGAGAPKGAAAAAVANASEARPAVEMLTIRM